MCVNSRSSCSIILPGTLLVNHFQKSSLPFLFYCFSVLLFYWNEGSVTLWGVNCHAQCMFQWRKILLNMDTLMFIYKEMSIAFKCMTSLGWMMIITITMCQSTGLYQKLLSTDERANATAFLFFPFSTLILAPIFWEWELQLLCWNPAQPAATHGIHFDRQAFYFFYQYFMSLKFLQLATCTNCKCNNMLYTWVKVVYINCTAIFLKVKLAGLQHRHLVTICLNPATEVCKQSTHALKQTWKSSKNSLYSLFVSNSHLFHSAENFSSSSSSIYWCLHGTFF